MSESVTRPRTSRPNRHTFSKSFAAAGVVVVASVIALIAFLGPPASPEGAGRVTATLVFPLVISALITGLWARASKKSWRWWKYLMVVALLGLAFAFVLALGRMAEQVTGYGSDPAGTVMRNSERGA